MKLWINQKHINENLKDLKKNNKKIEPFMDSIFSDIYNGVILAKELQNKKSKIKPKLN